MAQNEEQKAPVVAEAHLVDTFRKSNEHKTTREHLANEIVCRRQTLLRRCLTVCEPHPIPWLPVRDLNRRRCRCSLVLPQRHCPVRETELDLPGSDGGAMHTNWTEASRHSSVRPARGAEDEDVQKPGSGGPAHYPACLPPGALFQKVDVGSCAPIQLEKKRARGCRNATT